MKIKIGSDVHDIARTIQTHSTAQITANLKSQSTTK